MSEINPCLNPNENPKLKNKLVNPKLKKLCLGTQRPVL